MVKHDREIRLSLHWLHDQFLCEWIDGRSAECGGFYVVLIPAEAADITLIDPWPFQGADKRPEGPPNFRRGT